MSCVTTCACQCHQIGCGCAGTGFTRTAPTTPASPTGLTASCEMCEQQAPAIHVRTDGGALVIVIFCGRCDVPGKGKK